jgi:hypothetical protein
VLSLLLNYSLLITQTTPLATALPLTLPPLYLTNIHLRQKDERPLLGNNQSRELPYLLGPFAKLRKVSSGLPDCLPTRMEQLRLPLDGFSRKCFEKVQIY